MDKMISRQAVLSIIEKHLFADMRLLDAMNYHEINKDSSAYKISEARKALLNLLAIEILELEEAE